jgi:hypothetical protein
MVEWNWGMHERIKFWYVSGDVASSMPVSLNTCCSSLASLTSAFLAMAETCTHKNNGEAY